MSGQTFGRHVPDSTTEKAQQSVMAAFTRGLSLGVGTQWKFKFANGYGASVINDGYGRDHGLFELAVIGPDGRLNYETPIADDVLGYLRASDVADVLDKIEALEDGVTA